MRLRHVLTVGTLAWVVTLAGCSDGDTATAKAASSRPTAAAGANGAGSLTVAATETGRWYSPEQVERGAAPYAAICASCHGKYAQGTFAWRQPRDDGKLPPPPLDGSAHAWHHPLRALASQVKHGTPGGQGSMPGFAHQLSDAQVLDVLAWVQSRWPDEIYAKWEVIDQRSRAKAR